MTSFGAETFGDSGAINRGITRANHDNIAANDKFVHVHFALLDVFQSIQNVFLAGNAESSGDPQAHTKKHCAKVNLQVGQRKIRAKLLTCLSLMPSFVEHCDFRQCHLDGFAKANDSIGRKTACQITPFEQSYTMPALGKFASTREARGSGPNDCHLFACRFRRPNISRPFP